LFVVDQVSEEVKVKVWHMKGINQLIFLSRAIKGKCLWKMSSKNKKGEENFH
jgi:hypothetical protein